MSTKTFHDFKYAMRFGALSLLCDLVASCYRADSVAKGLAPLAIVVVLFVVLGVFAFAHVQETKWNRADEDKFDEDAMRLHGAAHHGVIAKHQAPRRRT